MQKQQEQKVYHVIGLMSGSSLDGLDIAYCIFEKEGDKWNFSIKQATCIPYSEEWESRLRSSRDLSGRELWKVHTGYGHLLADRVREFMQQNHLIGKIDLIASHGHTVFHFPKDQYTTQIGDGAALAVRTGVPVACDFRSSDIALGGQGTPIVPIGDKLLFPDYDLLLNIGGIVNISIKQRDEILAFDICAANQVLNHYAEMEGQQYDRDGHLAASGNLYESLLTALEALPYCDQDYPKSLDNGYSREVIIPLMDQYSISTQDKLHTYCEHIGRQIGRHISKVMKVSTAKSDKCLVTGGGAFNKYLIERIEANSPVSIVLPDDDIIMYKEALVMAFIGLLRLRGEINVLASVTGAERDTVGGALYHP